MRDSEAIAQDWGDLGVTVGPVERDRISRDVGDFASTNYINLPLFYLPF